MGTGAWGEFCQLEAWEVVAGEGGVWSLLGGRTPWLKPGEGTETVLFLSPEESQGAS